MGLFDTFSQHHDEVYNTEGHKSSWSHELIGGAAGFAAMKAYEAKEAREGKPQSHAFAKELIAGIAAAEADKLFETKGLNFIDREKAKHEAKNNAIKMYEEKYEQ
ncbi:hypothetical protein K450DRAFT_220654 [Umbelopsis ramanniana AG]|uniref:CipC protein n=1 Tax=Umbelopsis ramanniana AG TaxID=1314678 RepID=A0AAD5EI22_UMBRA|nr:uncharacterized protein K450DRAFT_220654 [Umbelopsis ramanniana AG]KAI8583929.1 hypothetical protein K450DRAFT_220654 [Umbelopsis ramanniana AG]